MGKQIVHRLAVGFGDIIGDDFATMFAYCIQGEHIPRPIGVADVMWDDCAWSMKTVHAKRPFNTSRVRLISGRNSPDYSMGISDPRADLAATGRAVLAIWNARVNESLGEYEDLRVGVLVRNIETREFVLFEEESGRFVPDNYQWRLNRNNNLEGYEIATGLHRFTWQPHGSQFTIIRDIPASARKFKIIPNVAIVEPDVILESVGYGPEWIHVIG